MEVNESSRFCKFCKNNTELDHAHEASPLHKFNYLLWNWNKNRKSLVRNRHAAEVLISKSNRPLNHDVNNGRHIFKITPNQLLQQGNSIDFKCTVTNRRKESSIFVKYANVLLSQTWFSCHGSNNNNQKRIEIKPEKSYSIIIKFEPGNSILVGSYVIPICFSLETVGKMTHTFDIVRTINILVEEWSGGIESTESPFKGTPWKNDVTILPPTCKMYYTNKYPVKNKKILKYDLEEFQDMYRNDVETLVYLRNQMNPGNVTQYNYEDFWHIVLWLEEVKQEMGLQQYNMDNVSLKILGFDQLELEVPGLAEKRPSVIKGDLIDIRLRDDHTGYRGMINRVNERSVEIGHIDSELFSILEDSPKLINELDVRFNLSRLAMERQHNGVCLTLKNNLLPYLFPPEDIQFRNRGNWREVLDKEFFNSNIVHNEEQKTAVLKILNTTSAPYPYIIFGPPGTGKTVTIVEAILQMKIKTTHRILVCAPSNAACDVITEKLLPHCNEEELLRIMSESVDISSVHKIIIPYTNYEGDGIFRKILPEFLGKYRIVVTTLIKAGGFSGKYHPDVLFVDEAAQACEPEVCCALGLMDKGKRIILAGDPKQLGPSLSSEVAKNYGLGISLLERLMESDLYTRRDSNYITMLIQNFRNHKIILKIPNRLFYDNQLQARSAVSETDPISKLFVFTKVEELYKKQKSTKIKLIGQPIEFCNLLSKESKEGKSPSYFNTMELEMTLKYIKALLAFKFEDKENEVLQTDIGVVTPYVRQVHKMKVLLQKNNLEEVEVGTTETFQGREKRIIIISTVRAKEDLLLEDRKFTLGFVDNEKRFNVALTRAMSKLIVIGCGHVLATDDKWLEYIKFCKELNSFYGVPLTIRTDDVIADITNKIKHIKGDTQYNHTKNEKYHS